MLKMSHAEALARIEESRRGFPLLVRGAQTFQDVFATSHRWKWGEPHTFPPRIIGENEVGPYCSVRRGGPAWQMDVVASNDVINAVAPRIVTPNDHLSFQIIIHEQTGYALVILQHSYIIGSHWLAYIDPASIPYRPVAS